MSYDAATIRQLNALTSEFYAREAASFSATRQAPWRGWEQAWDIIAAEDPALAERPLSVLDLGCGNLRFERFLVERATGPFAVTAVDNCLALASNLPAKASIDFTELDIVESLSGNVLASHLPHDTCDLAVAFGLMHHLPTFAMRADAIASLLCSLRPGGFAIASFWQFLNDARLAGKAAAVTDEGRAAHRLPPFEPGDYLLGWQHADAVYRFCHHADDDEIDNLLVAIQANPDAPPFREVARFSADGKVGNLNRYVVLRRCKPQTDSLC